MAFLPPKVITDKIRAYGTLTAEEKEELDHLCESFRTTPSSNEGGWFTFLLGFGLGMFL